MKLSSKTRYGVRAIFDIAFHNNGRPTQTKEIAERQGIPPRFLEQIFQDLKRAGIVTSKRGPRGGYQLARPTGEIRLGDLVRALEGPVTLSSAKDSGSAKDASQDQGDETGRAVIEEVFDEVAEQIESILDGKTIEELCERGEELGHRRRPPGRYTYVI